MQVFFGTPEIHEAESNVLKVKAQLRNGGIEVYPNHQNLIGKISTEIIAILTESKLTYYLIQDAIILVINKEFLELAPQKSDSVIYIYAKRALKLDENLIYSEVLNTYELKKLQISSLKDAQGPVATKTLLLNEELAFLQKVLEIFKKVEKF